MRYRRGGRVRDRGRDRGLVAPLRARYAMPLPTQVTTRWWVTGRAPIGTVPGRPSTPARRPVANRRPNALATLPKGRSRPATRPSRTGCPARGWLWFHAPTNAELTAQEVDAVHGQAERFTLAKPGTRREGHKRAVPPRTAAASACTVSTGRGSTLSRSIFGSFTPTHGVRAMRRSRRPL